MLRFIPSAVKPSRMGPGTGRWRRHLQCPWVLLHKYWGQFSRAGFWASPHEHAQPLPTGSKPCQETTGGHGEPGHGTHLWAMLTPGAPGSPRKSEASPRRTAAEQVLGGGWDSLGLKASPSPNPCSPGATPTGARLPSIPPKALCPKLCLLKASLPQPPPPNPHPSMMSLSQASGEGPLSILPAASSSHLSPKQGNAL